MASEESPPTRRRTRLRDPLPEDAPTPRDLREWFRVTEVRVEGDRCYYFGHAMVGTDRLAQVVWPQFDDAGYEVAHRETGGEDVLVARRSSVGVDGVPWVQLTLFALTVVSTLFAGSMWFHVDATRDPRLLWHGWPFAAGILTVLGVHELGHYAMTRYHRVEATLPYFIPVPTLIGTMGAVIRMKGRMPNRRALFDIGVAGPLAGLVATVAVTVVGLHLDPVSVPPGLAEQEEVFEIAIGFPALIEGLAWLTDQQLYFSDDPTRTVHPLVIAGWVGTLVTFLNLIPVGQLDGGHVLRAAVPGLNRRIAALVPPTLLGLAGYLVAVDGVAIRNVSIWLVWGVVTLVLLKVGAATPVDDATELGAGRKTLAAVTFVLGALCFAPVPIALL